MNISLFSNAMNKDTRYPFLFLVFTTLVALVAAIYYYFIGDDLTVPWEIITEAEAVNLPVDRIQVLLQEIPVQLKGFVITEHFEAGLPRPNLVAANLFLAILAISLIYFLALISTFRQLAFFAAILLLMLFLTTFNFDLLGIFGSQEQYLLISIITLLGGTTFLLQAFFTQVTFTWRLIIFTFLVAGIGIFLYVVSPLTPNQVTLHLLHYSSAGGIVAALLFIFWVSFENIHGLLWFNTQAENPARRFGLWQFLLICGLYLFNLILLYARIADLFKVEILLLNSFLILLFSAFIGFWGTQRREKVYENWLSFQNGAAMLYLVLAAITFLSIGYAFATANDALARTFTDLIVYTHLAYGLIFLVYILINFGRLINQRLRVYRVVFQPTVIPFYTVYIMGTILLVALLFRTNYATYDRAVAGYYNYLGDFYKATDSDILALKFYSESSVYEHNNVKAAYAQSAIYREKEYVQSEINQLNEALKLYPNPKLYIRLANKYPDRQHFFNRMFSLKEGLRKFPNNVPLLNNQALVYASIPMVDSADYFFDQAVAQNQWESTITSNKLAFYLLSGLGKQAIALAREQDAVQHLPLTSNLLLLESFTKQKLKTENLTLPTARILRPEDFTGFYHGILQNRIPANKQALDKINTYLASEENQQYHLDLKLMKALVQQRLNQTLAARTTLENLAGTEENYSAYLLDLIGLHLLDQKLYRAAANHFEQAQAKGLPDAALHYLYALAFLPDRATDALLLAGQLAESENPAVAAQANQLTFLMQASPAQVVINNSDTAKVQYLQLNQYNNSLTGEEFAAIASTVKNPDLKKLAQKKLAAYHVAYQNWPAAMQTLEMLLPQLDQENKVLSEANVLQAEIMLQNNQLPQLEKALSRMYFQGPDLHLKKYYQAALAERTGKIQEAGKYYNQAITAMPYHVPAVLAAANFFSTKVSRKNQAYDILLNSITYNPNEPEVYKAYILQSVEVGYGGFAETALEELAKLVSPTELTAFRQEYEAKVNQRLNSLGIGGQ
ncbi:hypothetical protein AAE02nite_03810 [Adhaeribacter aerolatus]|uniref:Uncharacterized protein n=1 Tax=Adhaeribacter aerolatus TaxID=670289 RepID=A0A512AT02_9BACT|nr:hypothetical protein [Adhaeribacter aerolatus]GEO02717.1 hypothetical protein AAE02nite_03810 [Adhaeribacter aerolatus]